LAQNSHRLDVSAMASVSIQWWPTTGRAKTDVDGQCRTRPAFWGALLALHASDLAEFCSTSLGAVEAVGEVWIDVLKQNGLRVPQWLRCVPPLIRPLAHEPDDSSDDEVASFVARCPQCHPARLLEAWARQDSKQAGGSDAGKSWYQLLALRSSTPGLHGLRRLEPALLVARGGATSARPPPVASWALLLLHSECSRDHVQAVETLSAAFATGATIDLPTEEAWRLAAAALLSCMVQAEAAEEATKVLNALIDVFLARGGTCASDWLQARELPPGMLGCRRAAAFCVAAVLTGHDIYHPNRHDIAAEAGDRTEAALLAAGAELLATLLPGDWGRGTEDSVDPVLRQAARSALQVAEVAKGGWGDPGPGLPDVALRGASRRLRVKLGLRLG